MMDYKQYLLKSIQASLKAGTGILEVYQADFRVEQKADDSPVTVADRRSHDIITENLAPFDIPILSEEGRHIAFGKRQKWDMLWIVDPLDGTKEFIKRNDEFTVNIALVGQGKPLLGVIYIPAKKTLYFAAQNLGAYKLKNRLLDQLLREKNKIVDPQGRLPGIAGMRSPAAAGGLAGSRLCFVPGRVHPAHSTEGRASDPLLRLVLQQGPRPAPQGGGGSGGRVVQWGGRTGFGP